MTQSKKASKKADTKKVEKTQEQSSSKKTTILGICRQIWLVVGSLLGIIAVFAIIYFNTPFFRSSTFPSLLPEDFTIAMIDISNRDDLKDAVWKEWDLNSWLQNEFQVDYNDMKDWWKQSAGIAVLNIDDEYAVITALNYSDQKKAKAFMEKIGEKIGDNVEATNYKNEIIYSYSGLLPHKFALINRQLLITNNEKAIQLVIDTDQGEYKDIRESKKYDKVKNNVPRKSLAQAYLNGKKLHASRKGFLSGVSGFNSLLKIFQYGGASISKHKNGFGFQMLSFADKSKLSSNKVFSNQKKFEGKLPSIIPIKNASMYFGGIDFQHQFDSTREMLAEINPAFAIIAEGILDAQVQKYLGPDINLRDDILPLFSDEYALTIAWDGNSIYPVVSLLLQSKNEEEDVGRMQKLFKALEALTASLIPKVETITLPDGTKVDELVSDEKAIKIVDDIYRNVAIEGLRNRNHPVGFYHAAENSKIIISTNRSSLEGIIDTMLDKKGSLAHDHTFTKLYKDILLDADEISYISLSAFEPILSRLANQTARDFISQFSAIMWKKKGYDDGVSIQGVVVKK